MSLAGLLLRFAGIYIALLFAAQYLAGAIGGIGAQGLNAVALVAAGIGATMLFGRSTGRALEPREKRNAILGMWATDVGFQLLVAAAVIGVVDLAQSAGWVLSSFAIVALLDLLLLYFAVGWANRFQANRVASTLD